MDKKIILLFSIVLYLLSTGISFMYFSPTGYAGQVVTHVNKTQESTEKEQEDEGIIDYKGNRDQECPINGEYLTKQHKEAWLKRRPLVVMIENHKEARPQSGLNAADVIYEAVAEGGITRFAAVFYCKDAPYIGPVRSARVYFIDFASEYGMYPLYAHVGGANTPGPADALGKIRKLKWEGYNDLNQFGVPFPYFYRDYDRLPARATEHTMYSSTIKLWEFADAKRNLSNKDEDGELWDKQFVLWKFKDDEPKSEPVRKIAFNFWEGKGDYSVVWNYVEKGNKYIRVNGGQKHTDNTTGQQISAKNVIIAFMKESVANDGYEKGQHLLYQTVGSGKALLFQDGTVVEGTWQKPKADSKMILYSGGSEVSLNRGKVFIEILPTGNEVEY